jgi:hypothetical protein
MAKRGRPRMNVPNVGVFVRGDGPVVVLPRILMCIIMEIRVITVIPLHFVIGATQL